MSDGSDILIIVFDVGTYFTEIWYTKLNDGKPHPIDGVPELHGSHPGTKFPTCVAYPRNDIVLDADADGEPASNSSSANPKPMCGWPAKDISDSSGFVLCEGFKPFLSGPVNPKLSRPQPWNELLGMTWKEVLQDFLDYVYTQIEAKLPENCTNRYFFFSLPTRYCTNGESPETEAFKEIITATKKFPTHESKIFMTQDSEAAACYAIKETQHPLKNGDHLVIIDTGRDDIDVVPLEVKEINGKLPVYMVTGTQSAGLALSLHENGPPVSFTRSGQFVVWGRGSAHILRKFSNEIVAGLVDGKKESRRYENESNREKTEASFLKALEKFRFDAKDREWKIQVYPTDLQHPANVENRGFMTLKSSEFIGGYIKEAPRILFNEHQFMEVLKKTKAILCIGGMGSSPWFADVIGLQLDDLSIGHAGRDISILRPPNPSSAVCLGSLERGLQILKAYYSLKKSFAIAVTQRNKEAGAGNKQNETWQWFLEKGQFFDETTKFPTFSMPYILRGKEEMKKVRLRLISYEGDVASKPKGRGDPSAVSRETKEIGLDVNVSPLFSAKISTSKGTKLGAKKEVTVTIKVEYLREVGKLVMSMSYNNEGDHEIARMWPGESDWA